MKPRKKTVKQNTRQKLVSENARKRASLKAKAQSDRQAAKKNSQKKIIRKTSQKPARFKAQLEKISEGHYLLKGQLNFQSVPDLWKENRLSLFDDPSPVIDINLAQLERSDSSGLSILVEWYREAEQRGKRICFINLPEQMFAVARVCQLHEILPLKKQ
jgi:phospholipid transport system transporter-binding protein